MRLTSAGCERLGAALTGGAGLSVAEREGGGAATVAGELGQGSGGGCWASALRAALTGGAGLSAVEREEGSSGGCSRGDGLARRRLLGRPRKEKWEEGKKKARGPAGEKACGPKMRKGGNEKDFAFSFSK